jgi:hypothetical protein
MVWFGWSSAQTAMRYVTAVEIKNSIEGNVYVRRKDVPARAKAMTAHFGDNLTALQGALFVAGFRPSTP